MATAVLVNRDFDVGRRVLNELAKAGIRVSVAFWAHVSDIDEWLFFVATPLVDSKGPTEAYDEVLRVIDVAGLDSQLPWRRLFLRSPKDPILRSLEKDTEIPEGSIHIMESENIPKGSPSAYYVTYTPKVAETLRIVNASIGDRFIEDAYVYGKTWAVTGLEHLKEMLSKLLHSNRKLIESVLTELTHKKQARIPNVRLSARDLKRLRPV